LNYGDARSKKIRGLNGDGQDAAPLRSD